MEIQCARRVKAVMSSAGLRLAVAPDAGTPPSCHRAAASGLCTSKKPHFHSLSIPIASSVCLGILWFVLQHVTAQIQEDLINLQQERIKLFPLPAKQLASETSSRCPTESPN